MYLSRNIIELKRWIFFETERNAQIISSGYKKKMLDIVRAPSWQNFLDVTLFGLYISFFFKKSIAYGLEKVKNLIFPPSQTTLTDKVFLYERVHSWLLFMMIIPKRMLEL